LQSAHVKWKNKSPANWLGFPDFKQPATDYSYTEHKIVQQTAKLTRLALSRAQTNTKAADFAKLLLLNNTGYWHQRADERHGNPPPRLAGAISGQRQSCKTPSELGVSKSMECDIFPSVLW